MRQGLHLHGLSHRKITYGAIVLTCYMAGLTCLIAKLQWMTCYLSKGNETIVLTASLLLVEGYKRLQAHITTSASTV